MKLSDYEIAQLLIDALEIVSEPEEYYKLNSMSNDAIIRLGASVGGVIREAFRNEGIDIENAE